jgi:hypothetical protein
MTNFQSLVGVSLSHFVVCGYRCGGPEYRYAQNMNCDLNMFRVCLILAAEQDRTIVIAHQNVCNHHPIGLDSNVRKAQHQQPILHRR